MKQMVRSFLEISWQRFTREFPAKQEGIQRDAYGVYAYIFQRNGHRYVFCAKASQDGADVSCHEKLVYEAARTNCQIIMMIGTSPYRFFPYDILRSKPRKNQFHGATMLNFPLTIGKNVREIGRKRGEASPVQETLFVPEEGRKELPAGDR